MERSVPSTNWTPGKQWITDSVRARNMEGLLGTAGQMATKVEYSVQNEEYDKSYAIAFAVVPAEGQYDKASPLLAVFRFFNR